MDNNYKAVIYGRLLNEHTRLHNLINEIKGQNIDLTKSDIEKIKELENKQVKIMSDINRLLS
jgi:hypothetical protein